MMQVDVSGCCPYVATREQQNTPSERLQFDIKHLFSVWSHIEVSNMDSEL